MNENEKKDHHVTEVLINDKLYKFEKSMVTGHEIKARAGIADNFTLYKRNPGSNEPIRDDEEVLLHNGDHFFSRPPSNVS